MSPRLRTWFFGFLFLAHWFIQPAFPESSPLHQHTDQDCSPAITNVEGKVSVDCADIEEHQEIVPDQSLNSKGTDQRSPGILLSQHTTGFCSPAIANVTGNVRIECKGVSPKVMEKINEELAKTKLSLAEKIAQAENLAKKYFDLKSQVFAPQSSPEEEEEIDRALENGEYDKAQTLLTQKMIEGEAHAQQLEKHYKEELRKDHQGIAKFAYGKGHLFDLQFQPLKALPFYAKAYRYDSANLVYAHSYAVMLGNQNRFPDSEKVYLHLIDTLRGLAKDDQKAFRLLSSALYDLGTMYEGNKRWTEAESALQESLAISRQLVEEGDADKREAVSNTLTALGLVYANTNQLVKAATAYQEALAFQKKLVKTHERFKYSLRHTLGNLALLYTDSGQFQAAETAYQEGIALQRELVQTLPAAYEPALARMLYNLAGFYRKAHRPEEARQTISEAVTILRRLVKANPQAYQPDLANALMNLGLIESSPPFEKAEAAFQEAEALWRGLAEENAEAYLPDLAKNLNNKALLYMHPGNTKVSRAEAILKESAAIRRRLFLMHPAVYRLDLARSLSALGLFYTRYTIKLEEAEAALNEAVAIYRELAEKFPAVYEDSIASNLISLGEVFVTTHRLEEAERVYEEALPAWRKLIKANPNAPGPRAVLSATSRKLAKVYQDLQQPLKAERLYKENLSLYRLLTKETAAVFKPKVETTLEKLSKLYIQTKQYGEAQTTLLELVSIRRELASQEAPKYQRKVLDSLLEVGRVYELQEQGDKAEVVYKETLREFRPLGATNPDLQRGVVITLDTLGTLYWRQEQFEKVEMAWQETLALVRSDTDSKAKDKIRAEAWRQFQLGRLYNHTHQWIKANTVLQDAVTIFRDLVKGDPNYSKEQLVLVQRELAFLNHEGFFDFSEAFALREDSLRRYPRHLYTRIDFAESLFTTARFTQTETYLESLLIEDNIDAETTIALHVIEIGSLLAQKKMTAIPQKLDALESAISIQPPQFKMTWIWDGTIHFIAGHPAFTSHKDWLLQLITALEGESRRSILEGVQHALVSFSPKMGQNHTNRFCQFNSGLADWTA